MKYIIRRSTVPADIAAEWDSGAWARADIVRIDRFRPEGSAHRPETTAKVVYDDNGLYVHFMVRDRYVICTHRELNSSVCKDSCAEFFFQPFGSGGYFNFETNCGGTQLCYFIKDSTRTEKGLAQYSPLTAGELGQVKIFHTMPALVEEEITEPVDWRLAMFIPFAMLENYIGVIDRANLPGSVWRGNFFKCADLSSHNHWASWCPVSRLNFHLPECFGELEFE